MSLPSACTERWRIRQKRRHTFAKSTLCKMAAGDCDIVDMVDLLMLLASEI